MAQQVPVLFSELEGFIHQENFDHALKKCDQILALARGDEDAHRCRILCLLQLGKYREALDGLLVSPVLSQMVFERAYLLYQLGSLEESLKLLGMPNPRREEVLLLEGQVCYRLGQYDRAVSLYNEVLERRRAERDGAVVVVDNADLYTNLTAAYIMAGRASEGLQRFKAGDGASKFELSFNVGRLLIELGDLPAAHQQLEKAYLACREQLAEEGLSEREQEDETSALRLQLAYVSQLRGQVNEALALYNLILKIKPSDAAVVEVARHNIDVIKKEKKRIQDLEAAERKKLRQAERVGDDGSLKKTKKKKKRLPKNFDPENPGPMPDPERWLPKHLRSSARKQNKAKNKGKQPAVSGKGAQGGFNPKEAEKLNVAAQQAAAPPTSSKQQQNAALAQQEAKIESQNAKTNRAKAGRRRR